MSDRQSPVLAVRPAIPRSVIWAGAGILLLLVIMAILAPTTWATPDQAPHGQTATIPQPAAFYVKLQRPNAPVPPGPTWVDDLTVTLESQDGYPGSPWTETIVLDNCGYAAWPGPGIGNGTYTMTARIGTSVENIRTAVVISDGVDYVNAPIYMGEMVEGDADANNTVDLLDFGVLRAAYFTSTGDPGYDVQADFDNDGKVNIRDMSLLIINFGATGPIDISALPLQPTDPWACPPVYP